MNGSSLMKKLVAGTIAATALAAPSAMSADQPTDTGQPENPGCFGELASTGGQGGLVGEFVRANAQNFKGNDGDSIGEDGTPFLKFIACPGDYRGRPSLEDQP